MDRPKDWVKYLTWAEFAYNSSYHIGAKLTPFEVVYGHKPPIIPMYIRGSSKLEVVDAHLQIRDELLKLLRAQLLIT